MEDTMNPKSEPEVGVDKKDDMEGAVTPTPVVEGEDSEDEEGDKSELPTEDDAEDGEKPSVA